MAGKPRSGRRGKNKHDPYQTRADAEKALLRGVPFFLIDFYRQPPILGGGKLSGGGS